MKKTSRLLLAMTLSVAFMLIECMGGYVAGSIAIYADAAHLLADVAGFGIALIAAVAAQTPPTMQLTFGLARAEVLGAVGSMILLWNITLYLLYAAFMRAAAWLGGHPYPVHGQIMFLVACFGIVVNSALGLIFFTDHGGPLHPTHADDHCGCPQLAGASSTMPSMQLSESGSERDIECGAAALKLFNASKKSRGYIALPNGEENKKTRLNSQRVQLISPMHLARMGRQGAESPINESLISENDTINMCHLCTDQKPQVTENVEFSSVSRATRESTQDVNMRAAYLHVLADLIQSFGVAVSALVLWIKPHWQIIDPLCTVVFSTIALTSTVPMIRRLGRILLEGVPENVSITASNFFLVLF